MKKGTIMTDLGRHNISASLKGRKKTPEHVVAMIAAKKRTRAARKLLAIRLRAFLELIDIRIPDDNSLRPLLDEVGSLLLRSGLTDL